MENSVFIVNKRFLDYYFSENVETWEMIEQMIYFLIWRANKLCGKKFYILNSEWEEFEEEWKEQPDVIAQAKAFVKPQDLFSEDQERDARENKIILAKNLSAFGKVVILDDHLVNDSDFDYKIGKMSRVYKIETCYDIIKQNKEFHNYIERFFSRSS